MRFYEKVMRFYEIESCYNAGKSQEKAKSLHFLYPPPGVARKRGRARKRAKCSFTNFSAF